MIEVRWHGRGGQGVVTAANILGAAALCEGRYAQSFPFFGAERRGAPVAAFTRIDTRPIRLRSQIYRPDWVVLLDDTLLELLNPVQGLHDGGILVVNSRRPAAALPRAARLIAFDATALAREWLGRPVVNTVMLGALAGAGLVGIEELAHAIAEQFAGETGERNVAAARAACALVKEVGDDVRTG